MDNMTLAGCSVRDHLQTLGKLDPDRIKALAARKETKLLREDSKMKIDNMAAAKVVSIFASKMKIRPDVDECLDVTRRGKDSNCSEEMEEEESKQVSWMVNYTLHPSGLFKMRWDVVVLFALMYTLVMTPYEASFNVIPEGTRAIVSAIVDICFGIDMVVSMNAAYYENHQVVTNRKRIAMRYFQSWFLIDAVSIAPLSQILNALGTGGSTNVLRLPKILRVLKLLRLLKLLRVMRLKSMMHKLETVYGVHAGLARLVKLVFYIFVVTHTLGCFWFLIPNLESDDGPNPKSWIARHHILNETKDMQYVSAVYWTFTTLTTVGFGDITSYTQAEKLYSLFIMALGVTWYAFIVSSMSSIMAGFDTYNITMREKTNRLNSFMRDAKLPKSLRVKLREHLEQASLDKANVYEANEVLRDLPATLRTDVLLYMYRNLISQIRFLDGKTKQFTAQVVVALRPMFVEQGDSVLQEGFHAEEMYFLVSGLGHVVKGGNVVAVLEPGCYFGEVGCLLSDIRHASVIATTYSELYSLLKADLLEIMVDYPVFAAELRQSALNSLQHDHDRVKSGNMQPAKENRDVALQREAILSSTGYISPKDSRIAFTDDTRHALDESWLKLHESLTQKVHEAEAKTVNAINDLIAQYST